MLNRLITPLSFLFAAVISFSTQPAAAQVTTTSSEYYLGPHVNFIGPYTTEIWARLYRPATLISGQRYPLIVMLHGQHGSCGKPNPIPGGPRIDSDDPQNTGYALNGVCPAGYTVVKSHEGYAYLANDLASRGYIVVSINTVRGFHRNNARPGDSMMLRERGTMVLHHLKLLSEWNRGVSTAPSSLGISLQNRLDFNHVGLMGHSRGALGMRSAIADYRNIAIWRDVIPGMTIRGLIEIAPPDEEPTDWMQQPPINDIWDVPFLHLVGLCDGENVSDNGNPVPSKHFDRLLMSGADAGKHFKAQYGIEGANHRYFNTEWQQNDAKGCVYQTSLLTFASTETGSALQQDRARLAVRNFFMATVGTSAGANASLVRIFNPTFPAPSGHRVSRAFSASPTYDNSLRLEEFNGFFNEWDNAWTNSNGPTNIKSNLTSYIHDVREVGQYSYYPFAEIRWGAANSSTYLQSNWTWSGWNLSGYKYLEFRVDNEYPLTGNTPEFSIRLVGSNGVLSNSVSSAAYVTLSEQPGTTKSLSPTGNEVYYHQMMKTVRIPLSAFNYGLNSVRGVRFVFDRTSNGSIAIGSVVAAVPAIGEP